MNTIKGTIASVTVNQSLSHLRVVANDISLSVITMFTPDEVDFLIEGESIELMFKETEVIIAKGKNIQISLRNQLPGKISAIESGKILSKITVNTKVGTVNSIITVNAVKQLGLDIGTEVTAMIKTNEMMIKA